MRSSNTFRHCGVISRSILNRCLCPRGTAKLSVNGLLRIAVVRLRHAPGLKSARSSSLACVSLGDTAARRLV
jgi:hypothetical protein